MPCNCTDAKLTALSAELEAARKERDGWKWQALEGQELREQFNAAIMDFDPMYAGWDFLKSAIHAIGRAKAARQENAALIEDRDRCAALAEVRELEADRLAKENADYRDWARCAHGFAWAHENTCPRNHGHACNCGLDAFLARPRLVMGGYRSALRAIAEAIGLRADAQGDAALAAVREAAKDRSRLEAENARLRTLMDSGYSRSTDWVCGCGNHNARTWEVCGECGEEFDAAILDAAGGGE
jgi:hypothetical protein